jgi:hypothetical protein
MQARGRAVDSGATSLWSSGPLTSPTVLERVLLDRWFSPPNPGAAPGAHSLAAPLALSSRDTAAAGLNGVLGASTAAPARTRGSVYDAVFVHELPAASDLLDQTGAPRQLLDSPSAPNKLLMQVFKLALNITTLCTAAGGVQVHRSWQVEDGGVESGL